VHGVDGFSGVALALSCRQKDPSGFEQAFEGWFDVALIFLEPAFTKECAGRFFFDGPIAKTQQGPMADIAEQTVPRFFQGELFADELRYTRIAPECGAVGKIVESVRAQAEAGSFENGNGDGKRMVMAGHSGIVVRKRAADKRTQTRTGAIWFSRERRRMRWPSRER